MEFFKPKGAVAEWRSVYDLFAARDVDDVVTYDELKAALGRSVETNRAPVYRATQELMKTHKHAVTNERGVGYRIARPGEHAGLAVKQRSRARRAIGRGVRIIDGTDRSKLTPAERKRFDDLEMNMRAQSEMLRRTEARVSVLEKKDRKQDDRLDLLVQDLRRRGIDVSLEAIDDDV